MIKIDWLDVLFPILILFMITSFARSSWGLIRLTTSVAALKRRLLLIPNGRQIVKGWQREPLVDPFAVKYFEKIRSFCVSSELGEDKEIAILKQRFLTAFDFEHRTSRESLVFFILVFSLLLIGFLLFFALVKPDFEVSGR